MAIKTSKCVICGIDVTKPQSYAYKDGRACRHHPEVQHNHEIQEQAKKNDLEEHKVKPRTFGEYKEFDHESALRNMGIKNPNEYCWCCDKEGIYEHLIYERFLINMSKTELKSSESVPFFDIKEDKISLNNTVLSETKKQIGNKIALRRIVVIPDYPEWKLKQILKGRSGQDRIQLVKMTGIIVLCNSCATEYDFAWERIKDKGMTVDQLSALGSFVKPLFDGIAAKEIAQEEISNIMNK